MTAFKMATIIQNKTVTKKNKNLNFLDQYTKTKIISGRGKQESDGVENVKLGRFYVIMRVLIAFLRIRRPDKESAKENKDYDIKSSNKICTRRVDNNSSEDNHTLEAEKNNLEDKENYIQSKFQTYCNSIHYHLDNFMNVAFPKEQNILETTEPEERENEDNQGNSEEIVKHSSGTQSTEEKILASENESILECERTDCASNNSSEAEEAQMAGLDVNHDTYDKVNNTKASKVVDFDNDPAHNCSLMQQVCDRVETLKEELNSPSVNQPTELPYVKNIEGANPKLTHTKYDSRGDVEEITCLRDLFHMRYFRIRSPELQLYMVPDSQVHPKRIGDIPWNWLREELWRLHTFSNYPHQTMKSALLLAENGFAYIGSGRGNDDKVICYFCTRTKSGWRAEDVIPVVHRDLSPQCPMITGINCNNKRMSAPNDPGRVLSQLFSKQPQAVSNDHPKNYRNDIQPDAVPATRRRDNDIQSDAVPDVSQASRGRQQTTVSEQASAARQTGPAKPIQMANSSFMRSSGRPPVSNPASRDQVSVFAAHQPTQNDAPSSTVTSNNPTPQQAVRGVPQGSSTQQQRSSTNSGQSAGTPAQSAGGSATPAQSRPTGNPGHSSTSSSNPSTTSNTRTTAGTATAVTSSTTPSQSNPSGTAASTNTTSSTTTTSTTASTNQTSSGETGQRPAGRGPTYGELGIITERPKRYEYAVKERRLETFEHWPRDHHLTKEDLSDAGFYYAGYGDCARCFYCGGGLRNWEDNDNVWVEHARWFPKCAFIRQQMGQAFVEAVQDLNKSNDIISMEMVRTKLGVAAISFQLDTRDVPLKRDPAVKTVLDMGYSERDVLEAAEWVKNEYSILSADKLFEKLEREGKPKASTEPLADSQTVSTSIDMRKERETMDSLKDLNNQLRQQTVCKICMDKEVSIVFLPCGHFVSCTDCAAAMKDCPVCRNTVRGIVRAFMS